MQTRVIALLLATGLVGCSSPTGPAVSFTISSASGTYDVTLAIASQGSFGPSCGTLVADLSANGWDAAHCINGVGGSLVSRSADTLTLQVVGGASTRPIRFYSFTGSIDAAQSSWDGAYCWPDQLGCVREHGTATWRRR